MRKRTVAFVVTCVTLLSLGSAVSTAGAARQSSTVKVLDQHAAVSRKKAPTKFVAVKKTVPVASGDTVQTDEVGFAEVHYPDGSLTRVDVNTTFVVDLATKTATKITLSSGQVWNEVKTATGSQPHFEVATPNATAAVRGTAFGVRCDDEKACAFGVVDGTVEVTSAAGETVALGAGQQVGVDAAGTVGETETLVVGQWIKQNQYHDYVTGGTAPGLTGTPAGLTASPSTPKNIAAAISAERAEKIAAGNFIGAPYTSVTCTGSGVLKKGDVAHCTANGPSGTSIVYRAVVLDAKGKFGLTRHRTIVDTAAAGKYLVSVPEDDGGLLVSAACGSTPYMVVDVPSATFVSCALVDDSGRTGDEELYLDADGALQSQGATMIFSGGDPGVDVPVEEAPPAEEPPPSDEPPPSEEPAPSDSGGSPPPGGGGAVGLA